MKTLQITFVDGSSETIVATGARVDRTQTLLEVQQVIGSVRVTIKSYVLGNVRSYGWVD